MDIDRLWKGWKIDEFIGEGAFGRVYKIIKEEFGHTYKAALKVIEIPQNQSELQMVRSEGLSREETTEYFKNMVEDIVSEVILMSQLKGNSYIVGYEDHIVMEKEDEYGWEIYVKMELLTPLFEYIGQKKLTVKDGIQLGIDMCKALEVCQKSNIIHRDIKPENIFVSEMGTFKLGDFGIARQLEKTSAGLSKKGTHTYMAPEVFKGLEYNSTVDIYSLGIVLYRFFNNNRTPFMPPAPEKIKYTDKENANSLRLSGEKMPKPCNAEERLAEIILKACAYESKDRYQNPTDMRIALEEILDTSSEEELVSFESDFLNNEKNDYTMGSRDKKSEYEGTKYLFHKKQEIIDKNVELENNSEKKTQKNNIQQENKEKDVLKNDTEAKVNLDNKKIGMLLGILAGIVIVISLTVFLINSNRQYIVPNYIGMDINTLDADHFEVIVEREEYSNELEKGKVISQNIKGGEKLKRGNEIRVVISKGIVTKVDEDTVQIFIGTSPNARGYMAMGLNKTSEQFSFKVSGYGIESYTFESTNTESFTVAKTEDGGIVINSLNEGTGYVELSINTTDGKILLEKIFITVYKKIDRFVGRIKGTCNVYKGATDSGEVDNHDIKGVLSAGYEVQIRDVCGDFYLIKTRDKSIFTDGKDTGFVKKSDIEVVK